MLDHLISPEMKAINVKIKVSFYKRTTSVKTNMSVSCEFLLVKLLGIGSFERHFEDMVDPLCRPSRSQRLFQNQFVSQDLNLALGGKQEVWSRGDDSVRLLWERLITKHRLQKGK